MPFHGLEKTQDPAFTSARRWLLDSRACRGKGQLVYPPVSVWAFPLGLMNSGCPSSLRLTVHPPSCTSR